MEPKTDCNRPRRLILWWSIGSLALLAILALLFWVGYRSDESPSPPVSFQSAGELTPPDVDHPVPVVKTPPLPVVETGSEPAGEQPPTNPQPITSAPEDTPDEDPPADNSDQTPLPSLGDDPAPKLPNDWAELTSADKISLNPFSCDLSIEEINLDDGRCRQRSTPASNPRPWNPTALNLFSTTEVENRSLKISCYNQDLSYLLNTPSQPVNPGGIDWTGPGNLFNRPSPSPNGDVNSRSSPTPNNNSDNNRGFRHCVLRVVLEMTVDGFYFPNGCRTWRSGFVKLVGAKDGEAKTYSSLSTPAPGVLCTKNTVPIAKGQKITQTFLFEIPDSDLNSKVTQIKFGWLEPRLAFKGNFGFKSETKPPTADPLRSLY